MATGPDETDVSMDVDMDVSINESTVAQHVTSLYLNPNLSDFTFRVREERLFAHKFILVRCKCFESFFTQYPGPESLRVSNTSPEAFKILLKYIYTDIITIPSDNALILEVLILAEQHPFKHLAAHMVRQIKARLDANNIIFFFNEANKNDLGELRNICHSFMAQILSPDTFIHLTKESVLEILNQDIFVPSQVPLPDIFNSIIKWCEKNNYVDHVMSACVRLSLLSISEIMSTIRPKLESPEKIKETLCEVVGNASKKFLPRCVLFTEGDFLKGGVFTSPIPVSSGIVESDDDDVNIEKHTGLAIDGENESVICLNGSHYVNHIRLKLYDYDNRYYSYYIDTSLDEENWHRVVDYTQYGCRSIQNLYFDQRAVRYIRIVGTNVNQGKEFMWTAIEAFYESHIPKTMNTVIRPEKNVATVENKTMVKGREGSGMLNAENKDEENHIIDETFAEFIIVQLAQPYLISSMRFLLPDQEDDYYRYKVEISTNKEEWDVVPNLGFKISKSWQILHFTERVVIFIKITGTYHSLDNVFRCSYFECPSSIPKSGHRQYITQAAPTMPTIYSL